MAQKSRKIVVGYLTSSGWQYEVLFVRNSINSSRVSSMSPSADGSYATLFQKQ